MRQSELQRSSIGAKALRSTSIVAAFLALILAAACDKAAPPPPTPPAVEVVTVAQRDVPIYMEWIGSLDGNVNAVIRPQVTGYLIKQNYREGDLVKQGQPLFEIDRRTFESAVEEAKGLRAQQQARYVTSSANLARIKPLAAQNAVSQKDLDDAVGSELSAKAALDAAEASLKTAQLNLGFTRITSPITGIAGIAKAQIGDLLSPSMAAELTTVSAIDPIKVYFNISEREYLNFVAKHRPGENKAPVPIELILVDGSSYPENGKFLLLDRQVDATTGTFKAVAQFPNAKRLLRPGQYGKIRVTMSVAEGALLVPQRAVTEMQGRYLVAVVGADNKVDIRPVTVGERIGTEWVIGAGLKPGETVVAEGTQKVRPGSMVSPKPFAPAAPAAAGGPANPEAKPAAPAPAPAAKG